MKKKVTTNSPLSQLQPIKPSNSDKYSWDDLSEFQKQQINAGLDDIKYGRVMSSEEFWNQLRNG